MRAFEMTLFQNLVLLQCNDESMQLPFVANTVARCAVVFKFPHRFEEVPELFLAFPR